MMMALDVAGGIDLDLAERLIRESTSRPGLRPTRRAPSYLAVRPAPLRIVRAIEAPVISQRSALARAELTLYDFGAVSVAFDFEVEATLEDLLPLASELYENADMTALARRLSEQVLREVGPAVQRGGVGDAVEDYVVYRLSPCSQQDSAQSFVRENRAAIAQLLRGETETLSEGEINDAMASVMSFGLRDVSVIDWNGALVIDPEPADTLLVLEFANVELLEMRHLDDRLDASLDEAFKELRRRSWRDWLPIGSPLRSQVEHLAELRADGALMFEGVNNALKLLGDQYLARLYRLVTVRLGTPAWDASILRKLDALESLNQKLNDIHTHRRMEVLEWIIIMLIALSMVQAVVMGK